MFEDTAIKRHKMRQDGILALDWQAVYDWTEQRPAGAIIGKSCTNGEDPLGVYLGEKTGTPSYYWSIGPVIKNGYGDRLPKPEWVKQAIQAIDCQTGNWSGPVTREMFLEALALVKPATVSGISQEQSLSLIDQALTELDDEYQTSIQAVQVWLRQHGIELELARVKMDVGIVRELKYAAPEDRA